MIDKYGHENVIKSYSSLTCASTSWRTPCTGKREGNNTGI